MPQEPSTTVKKRHGKGASLHGAVGVAKTQKLNIWSRCKGESKTTTSKHGQCLSVWIPELIFVPL